MSRKINTISKTGELRYSSFTPLDHPIQGYTVRILVKCYIAKEDIFRCSTHGDEGGNQEKIANKGDKIVIILAPVKKSEAEEPREEYVSSYVFIVESADKSPKRDGAIWRRSKEEIETHCEFSEEIVREEVVQLGRLGEKLGHEYCFSFNFGLMYNKRIPVRVLVSTEYYNTVMIKLLVERGHLNSYLLPTQGKFKYYNAPTGCYIDHEASSDEAQENWTVLECPNEECKLCNPRSTQSGEFSPVALAQREIESKEEGPNDLEQGEAQEEEEVEEAENQ